MPWFDIAGVKNMVYIKLQNNEGSETKLSDDQIHSKYSESVIRVFSGPDDLYSNTSLFSSFSY